MNHRDPSVDVSLLGIAATGDFLWVFDWRAGEDSPVLLFSGCLFDLLDDVISSFFSNRAQMISSRDFPSKME